MANQQLLGTLRTGAIAGAAGGLAEVAWVTLYAAATGGDASVLAKGITTAAGVGALVPNAPVITFGVSIHMALAVTLGIALAFAWRRLFLWRLGAAGPFLFGTTALAVVWALNFFVMLPIVSPSFVHLVPFAVSLTSKLLFGFAAGGVIASQEASAWQYRWLAFVRRKV